MAKPADTKAEESNASRPPTLFWLWDAPLFIDDVQVGRFYDAVARPEAIGHVPGTCQETLLFKVAI
jgi:hypothetical protein